MLKHLNMASIKERTFFDHQKKYLAPAILSVWNESQTSLLSECVSNGPLTIGGDGRADSPGYSAKYGSYGVIDLSSNNVIHIELVQVYISNMYVRTLLLCVTSVVTEQSNEVQLTHGTQRTVEGIEIFC